MRSQRRSSRGNLLNRNDESETQIFFRERYDVRLQQCVDVLEPFPRVKHLRRRYSNTNGCRRNVSVARRTRRRGDKVEKHLPFYSREEDVPRDDVDCRRSTESTKTASPNSFPAVRTMVFRFLTHWPKRVQIEIDRDRTENDTANNRFPERSKVRFTLQWRVFFFFANYINLLMITEF